MTDEEVRLLRRDLAAITDRPWRFVFCPAGTDGFPVLLLARKRLPTRTLTTLMRWGRSRTLVRGSVVRSEGTLRFSAPDADPAWFFEMRDFFSPMIPELAEAGRG